jgi:hypothetical protein
LQESIVNIIFVGAAWLMTRYNNIRNITKSFRSIG